jgi:sugar/nucleoside kinase (ribokinase family)
MADVVGLGSPVMDLAVNVSQVPRGNGAVRANEIFHQGGGNCASAVSSIKCMYVGGRTGIPNREP